MTPPYSCRVQAFDEDLSDPRDLGEKLGTFKIEIMESSYL